MFKIYTKGNGETESTSEVGMDSEAADVAAENWCKGLIEVKWPICGP